MCSLIQANHVKRGGYVIIKGRPCKIVEMITHKEGKHGTSKVTLTGIDLVDKKKHITNIPAFFNLYEFKLKRKGYQLIYVDHMNNCLEYLDENGVHDSIYFDSNENLFEEIRNDFEEDKMLLISLYEVPIQVSEGNFKIERIVDSYREKKDF